MGARYTNHKGGKVTVNGHTYEIIGQPTVTETPSMVPGVSMVTHTFTLKGVVFPPLPNQKHPPRINYN